MNYQNLDDVISKLIMYGDSDLEIRCKDLVISIENYKRTDLLLRNTRHHEIMVQADIICEICRSRKNALNK